MKTNFHFQNFGMRFFILRAGLLVCLAWGSSAFATLDIRTTINPMQIGGSAERAGFLFFRMIRDDFPNATSSNPVYVRLRLDKNAALTETLVDVSASAIGHNPINVVVVVSSNSGSVINIPDESVVIARWRKGESSIWLKFSSSSSFWVTRDGVPGPPTISEPVDIILGQTVGESRNNHFSAFSENRANFPAPTRTNGIEVDTPLLIDLSQSNLQPAPAPDSLSLLRFDPLSLASNTQGVESSLDLPTPGSLTFPSFSGDTEIGRGIGFRMDRWLFHVPRDSGGFESEFLFSNRGPGNVSVSLIAYDSDANIVAEPSLVVPGSNFSILTKHTLFGDLPVSHVQILGPDDCIAGISYKASGEPSLTANAVESRKITSFWEYFPEMETFGFDGFALVNMGTAAAELTVSFLDATGNSLGEVALYEDQSFGPLSKKLLLLNDIAPQGTQPTLVRFNSSQALGVVALKGTLAGHGPRSLFPVTIFTTVVEN